VLKSGVDESAQDIQPSEEISHFRILHQLQRKIMVEIGKPVADESLHICSKYAQCDCMSVCTLVPCTQFDGVLKLIISRAD
jgi:hypothetical protein